MRFLFTYEDGQATELKYLSLGTQNFVLWEFLFLGFLEHCRQSGIFLEGISDRSFLEQTWQRNGCLC